MGPRSEPTPDVAGAARADPGSGAPARRAPTFRPSSHARGLQPARPESTPTCCARVKHTFPEPRKKDRLHWQFGRPRAPVDPLLGGLRPLRPGHLILRPVPAPGVPTSSTSWLPRPPRAPPSSSTHGAGPRGVFLPRRQAARTPPPRAQSRLHSWDSRLLTRGVPSRLSARPSPATLSATQCGRIAPGLAGGGDCETAGREGLARGGAGKLGAWSAAGASDWEPAPHRTADPRPRQPAAELSSAHSGRRECSTAERAMKETAAQVEARAAALQSGELGHTHFCLFPTPARILGDSLRASEHD